MWIEFLRVTKDVDDHEPSSEDKEERKWELNLVGKVLVIQREPKAKWRGISHPSNQLTLHYWDQ